MSVMYSHVKYNYNFTLALERNFHISVFQSGKSKVRLI